MESEPANDIGLERTELRDSITARFRGYFASGRACSDLLASNTRLDAGYHAEDEAQDTENSDGGGKDVALGEKERTESSEHARTIRSKESTGTDGQGRIAK